MPCNKVFTLGLRHTFHLWQRGLALVHSLVVQPSFASFRAVSEKPSVVRHEIVLQPKFSTLDTHFDGVGVVPQHQTMGPSYDYDAADSVHNLSFDSLVDFEPNFNTVILDDSAVPTDFVSSAPIRNSGFIVSSRVRDLLAGFTLPPHRVYDLPVVHRGSSVDGYSWLHLPQPDVSIPRDAKTN